MREGSEPSRPSLEASSPLDGKLVARLIGVPYTDDGMEFERDGGLNCWGLVRHVMNELGLDFPAYDEYVERSADWLFRGLDRFGADFAQVQVPRAGDIVAIRRGRNEWHVGVMVDNFRFLHTTRRTGVMVSRINHPLMKRIVKGFYRWQSGTRSSSSL